MIITTIASEYKITVAPKELQDKGYLWQAEKIKTIDPDSRFNEIGQIRPIRFLGIRIGHMADFGDWHTSIVTGIRENDEKEI
jgi:hypothetical protein